MRRHPFLVIVTVLVAAGVSLFVRYQLTGPRLTFTAVTRPGLTRADCIAEVQHFGYGIGADVCGHPSGRPAFHAIVTNVGGRGAWVSICTLDVLDARGQA